MDDAINTIISNSENVIRKIDYGGQTKASLLEQLSHENVDLNEYANILFSSSLYITSEAKKTADIVELSVNDLGFKNGGILEKIINKALEIGFSLCEMDIGPYLRLSYTNQIEEFEPQKNKAPKGSITILSKPLNIQDDDFPKGFYIRKINGKLWLRGYICPMDYVWDSDARIALEIAKKI